MKLLPILLLTSLLAPLARAERRVGAGEVRAGANGVPCFTLSASEEGPGGTPAFRAITVGTTAGGVMWYMALPRGRSFPLTASMCVPYGGRVQALPQTPAMPLEPGRIYLVGIDVIPRGKPSGPTRYEAWFCLLPGRAAEPGVHPIHGGAGRTGGCAHACRASACTAR